ncbi:unnamed protein product [Leptosia nina]|uniref:MYND-type domain-containing protein n=1 Tax=Leptosia nina TaxID=320188 RepID=A0AAV1JGS6_9NEOP
MKNTFRHFDTPVKAGDLLLMEEPFAYTLSSKESGKRCDHCFQNCRVLKCSGCQFVYYCGKSCQREAWSEHKWECANFKRVAPKVVPDGARMLAKIINRLRRGDGNSYKAFYTPTSFRMWKDLMSHYSDLKKDKKRMDHFTTLGVVLYEFLKDISLPNTVDLIGLYGRMVINSFTILDIDMNSIGTGIYIAASIIDHSCNPNAVATFDGKTINIRAIRDMPKLDWKQIRISYIDLMKTPFERQMELLENYYFVCDCDRCMDKDQLKYLHAAKCLNMKCDNPVNIKWKDDCVLVKEVEKSKLSNVKSTSNEKDSTSNGDMEDKNPNKKDVHSPNVGNTTVSNVDSSKNSDSLPATNNENADVGTSTNNENVCTEEDTKTATDNTDNVNEDNHKNGDIQETNKEVNGICSECGTKYTEQDIDTFLDAMDLSDAHLQNMKTTTVAYVEVCKYCLEKQQGVLHPLNVFHAQMLEQAFDAYIQVRLWQQACVYAEQLLPCFR